MNPLDQFARLILGLYGVDTKQFRQQLEADKRRAQNQKPIDAKGQTSAINRQGGIRDYRNTRQALTRQPTLDPIRSRQAAPTATPPNRPPGGFGQAPGQMSISQVTGGRNPSAVPGGQYRAPNVPPRMGAPTAGPGPSSYSPVNPYRATGQNLAPGMSGRNGLSIGGLLNHPLVQGVGAVDAMLNAFGTSILEETFGSGRVMEDFKRSQQSRQPAAPAPQTKPTKKPRQVRYPTAAEMQAAAAQQQQPAEVPMGRPDPFAPVNYSPPEQSYAPTPAPAPAPRVPSRKQLVNEAYDSLRAQLKAGEISHDDFLKQGMKMHKDYFNKK